jgi:tRNA threonylcarbamoyladenosine biosynthesis protein TsaE
MSSEIFEADNLEATQRLGRALGAALRIGDAVALIGPLGSGKTTLVKAVAVGAGVTDPGRVNSPTFVIVNEYDAGPADSSLRLYHIDAYRLRGGPDLEALGFDEMVTLGTVLIEWADRVPESLPSDRLTIVIEPAGEQQRRFTFEAGGPTAERLLQHLRTAGGLSSPP